MMKEVELSAEPRKITSKHALKKLRKEGKIPAVFYAHNENTEEILVDAKTFETVTHAGMGSNVLINLHIGSTSKTAMIKEIQRDMITLHPIHIDFQGISLKEKVEVKIPVHITGESPGVKLGGGVLEHIIRELKVKCLPKDIPGSVNVDVSNLQINQGIFVRDLPKIEGVDYLADPGTLIINIVSPTILEEKPEEVAAAVAGAPAEPEVISKGKKDKEGEEGAAAAPGQPEKTDKPGAGKTEKPEKAEKPEKGK